MDNKYVCSADDLVWRRSKLGLRMSPEQISVLDQWINDRRSANRSAAAE